MNGKYLWHFVSHFSLNTNQVNDKWKQYLRSVYVRRRQFRQFFLSRLTSVIVRNVIWMLCDVGLVLDIYFPIVLQFTKASDKEELKTIVESYQETLRNKANPKNLRKFVESFLKSVLPINIFVHWISLVLPKILTLVLVIIALSMTSSSLHLFWSVIMAQAWSYLTA